MEEKEKKVVRIHDVDVDKEYIKWINEIKARYRSSQIKAAFRVNAEQLRFNWLLGRDLVLRKAEEKWGSGIVEQVSLDLQAAFPESKGFGSRNIWYMKRWYEFYAAVSVILHQLGAELHDEKLHQLGEELQGRKLAQLVRESQRPEKQRGEKLQQVVREMSNEKLQQDVAELPEALSLVPWRHHIEIITRCKSIQKGLRLSPVGAAGRYRQSLLAPPRITAATCSGHKGCYGCVLDHPLFHSPATR